ncbi:MAG: right-handed parallel beta-helix repeat-containing protein [Thermoproteota archaeon]
MSLERKTTFYIEGYKDLTKLAIPVKREGNTYTLTDDIHGRIIVRESDIVIDGNGYSLLGRGKERAGDAGFGFHLLDVRNVVIKNLEIKYFDFGVFISKSSNITVSDNKVSENNYCGIYLWRSNNNRILKNSITYTGDGVDLYYSSDNVISENSIIKNDHGLYFFRSLNNTVSRNTIVGNHYSGICFRQSSKNIFLENNFTDNEVFTDKSSENNIPENVVKKILEDLVLKTEATITEKGEGKVSIEVDPRVKKVFIRIQNALLEGTDFANNIDIDRVKIMGQPAGGVRAVILLNPEDERVHSLALDVFADPDTGRVLSAYMFKEDFNK